LKKQREMLFGSSDLKVSGVYMPGDIVPKDEEKVTSKHVTMDSVIANSGMINIDGR